MSMQSDVADYQQCDWLVDYFIEESRMQSSRARCRFSPHEAWYRYEEYVRKAVAQVYHKYATLTPAELLRRLVARDHAVLTELREALYQDKQVEECAHEKASFLKLLFLELGIRPDHGRIFDGCAGWGDKLIAALAIPAAYYLGVDPNESSQAGFQELVETLAPVRLPEVPLAELQQRFGIRPLSMPDCVLPAAAAPGSFDVGFLSPPSFDSERYSTHEGQSLTRFPQEREWYLQFMFPTLERTWAMIRPGGFLVIQSILINRLAPFIEYRFADAFYCGAIAIECSTRFKPMWIWSKLPEATAPTRVALTAAQQDAHSYRKNHATRIIFREYPTLFPQGLPSALPPLPAEAIPRLYQQRAAKRDFMPRERFLSLGQQELARRPAPTGYTVRTFFGKNRFDTDQLGALRLEVWLASRTQVRDRSPRQWIEQSDGFSLHIVIEQQGRIVAATRLSIYERFDDMPGAAWFNRLTEAIPGPVGIIARLVVHPAHQRHGLGKYLDEICIAISTAAGCQSVFCDVPPYRIASLERMGFRVIMPGKFGPALPEIAWTAMLRPLTPSSQPPASEAPSSASEATTTTALLPS
jgi:GNAT superfamily N-acetyltransferase